MIHFCTLHSLLQFSSATFSPFVLIPLPSRHLSWPWLWVPFQTNTPGCFVTVSFNRLGREREREWQGNRSCASMHSFYLTSLWCETAQYSAFPDQWRLNTLSWGPCSGMVEMQIIHAPEIKSFQYLLNPKENIFFPFFQPVHRYLPAAMRARTARIHNVSSTYIQEDSSGLFQTFSYF